MSPQTSYYSGSKRSVPGDFAMGFVPWGAQHFIRCAIRGWDVNRSNGGGLTFSEDEGTKTPRNAAAWRNRPRLPSKACKLTATLKVKAYSAARQAASALHAMAILQVHQAKALKGRREENFYLCSVDGPRASGTHFFKERAIFFSSRFSDPRDDSVRCFASSLSHTTHLASSQESTVRGRSTSPRTSSQSRLGPREFCKEVSERAAFCTIQPYSPSLHHHRYVNCAVGATCTALEAWLSPFHWLTRTI